MTPNRCRKRAPELVAEFEELADSRPRNERYAEMSGALKGEQRSDAKDERDRYLRKYDAHAELDRQTGRQ